MRYLSYWITNSVSAITYKVLGLFIVSGENRISKMASGGHFITIVHIFSHCETLVVSFFLLLYICLLYDEVFLSWNFGTPGFEVRAHRTPQKWTNEFCLKYFGFKQPKTQGVISNQPQSGLCYLVQSYVYLDIGCRKLLSIDDFY